MKRLKPVYVTSGIFLLMIIGFMFSTVCVFALNKIDNLISDEADKSKIRIDWEAMYPFELENGKETVRRETVIEKTYAYIRKKCEEYSSDKLIGYYSIVESAKRYEDAISWNMASISDYNAVVKMSDDYLTVYTPSRDVTIDAQSTIEFAEFCRKNGIEFIYVNAPTKVCALNDKDISGVLDFKNQNTDRFLEMLRASGVRYYDLRKNLHEDGMNHHEAFYITDNHWKIETALWAAGHILTFLRDDYGWDVKPEMLTPERFNYDVYHEWFLGGRGKKATLARTKPEDFTFVYPKYETSIKLYEPDGINYTSGDFFVMCNVKELQEKDYYGKHTYNEVYKTSSFLKAGNNFVRNGKRILMIRDSFATGLLPYMILGTQNIEAIDLRAFTGSLKNYIKANSPDMVILMYYSNMPGVSSKKQASIREKKLYDFR